MTDSHDHDHDHDHDGNGDDPSIIDRLRRFAPHSHSHHGHGRLADTGAMGVRAAKVSLLGLGLTAMLQAVVVLFTGSVALWSDTLHNLTDALTAIPLWIAFSLGRRASTKRYTFGLGRTEDLAGLVIITAIAVSAGGVAWESIRRLMEPRPLEFPGWVIAAGLIGALGNELVARYRIRIGRTISSEALIADGHHARADALTSLAVVAAGVGSLLGADWVDPVAGLVVAVMILGLLRNSAARVFGRFLDAVDPSLIDRTRHIAAGVEGVRSVDDIRARWSGHRLLVNLVAAVDPEISVRQGHEVGQKIVHELIHGFDFTIEVLVHIDPCDDPLAHELTAHHE